MGWYWLLFSILSRATFSPSSPNPFSLVLLPSPVQKKRSILSHPPCKKSEASSVLPPLVGGNEGGGRRGTGLSCSPLPGVGEGLGERG
ncbi:hypothetical protein MC7420_6566 [Coleofasciculus chthonoplastes PCC 7420]|uniref:Uncharacterized protein n=1 Tax=Coleofasciculus chthonoplastes PCC 7420 TaxID=118168 RepID=B4W5B2_9CYAN|nr:hypothetical protein MC7420_6566 [Coleofasciculus chthonoplastes PCC 7420]